MHCLQYQYIQGQPNSMLLVNINHIDVV